MTKTKPSTAFVLFAIFVLVPAGVGLPTWYITKILTTPADINLSQYSWKVLGRYGKPTNATLSLMNGELYYHSAGWMQSGNFTFDKDTIVFTNVRITHTPPYQELTWGFTFIPTGNSKWTYDVEGKHLNLVDAKGRLYQLDGSRR